MRSLILAFIYPALAFYSVAAAAQSSIDVRVSSSADDAEERSSGSMYVDSSDLEMAFEGSRRLSVGIRFSSVDIPQGASITNAYIQFTVDETSTETAVLSIHAEDADHALGFNSDDNDISGRLLTGASVGWEPPPWTEVDAAGNDQRTPELTALVQAVVDRPAWQPGNGMAFIITGTIGSRVAESFDGTEDEAPLLHVEFTEPQDDPDPPPPPPPGQSTIDVRVSSSANDAEERENGSVSRSSSDLEMIFDGSRQQIVGVRFSPVDIPRGALITDAYIQFTVDEATSDSTVLVIEAQDADHAPAFGSSTNDISDRPLTTTSVGWEPPPWTEVDAAGGDQRTPNLAAIVQEVVDRPGWQPGNGMAFIVTGSAGSRVAESYNGTSGEAPLLHVEFTDQAEDTEPPAVVLTEPVPGEVSGNVTLTAEASDNIGIAGVTFELDGNPLGDPDTQEPYSFMWDTTAEPNGAYVLAARATDFAGNATASDPVDVEVANPAPPPPPPPSAGVVGVPEDEPTIQDGVDAAADGDTVLVAAGTYNERVVVEDKAVRIECANNDTTVIDPDSSSGEAVTFESTASGSALVNCRVRGASHTIVLNGDDISILGNRVEDTDSDAISVERTGGSLIEGNTITNAGDDCIDVDHPAGDTAIRNNVCIDPSDDGVEIRNSRNDDPPALIEIEGNEFAGAGEDGIQIIDYDGISNRTFVIARNLIRDSSDAGIGFMSDGETTEDFRAASIPEPVDIFNNTLSGNRYGITASGNVIILNNIIAGSTTLGFKGTPEVVAYTLFHDNATDYEGAGVDPNTTFTGDPEFDADFGLGPASAAIDAGTAQFVHDGSVVLDIPPAEYNGAAPDLGAFEF